MLPERTSGTDLRSGPCGPWGAVHANHPLVRYRGCLWSRIFLCFPLPSACSVYSLRRHQLVAIHSLGPLHSLLILLHSL
ncbi:hypothetical protein L209DRAFT_706823, partial [Thermothelomyces heterothallicus CBS 203.75]